MARPREFDELQALNSAMETFRVKGYEAASLMNLLEAMDLSKSSLYNSFGTKHQLFLATIDHYIANTIEELESRLKNAESLEKGVRGAFGIFIDQIINHGDQRGCFLHNCASEVLPHDTEAADHIKKGLGRMKDAFTKFIVKCLDRGEISPGDDPESRGEYLTMQIMGFQTLGRIFQDKSQLDAYVSNVIAATRNKGVPSSA